RRPRVLERRHSARSPQPPSVRPFPWTRCLYRTAARPPASVSSGGVLHRKEKSMASHRWSSRRSVCWFTLAAIVVLGLVWSAPGRVPVLRASGQPASAPLAALAPGVTLEGPFTHANLSVYVVRGSTRDAREYITLDEGLGAHTVAVREKTRAGQDRAEVNSLEIENRSDKWLFLQAGDIVKGGKQDRTI